MGLEHYPELKAFKKPNGKWVSYYRLNYHKDWNLLISVVNKIEGLTMVAYGENIKYFQFKIVNRFCTIMGYSGVRQDMMQYQTPYNFTPASKTHAVILAVVSFIQWYNQQSTQP